MPAEESTPAIVLRARDYAESDRIVTALTRDAGKLGGIAKGAKNSRRRFEGKLEPFSHVMLYFRRRPHSELVFMTRAEAAGLAPNNLADDLSKMALGIYMLDLADALTREGADTASVYQLLAEALAALSGQRASVALRQAFDLKILEWAGYGLEFARCRICAATPDPETTSFCFVIARGGVVCRRCRDGQPPTAVLMLSAASVRALAELGKASPEAAVERPCAGSDGELAIMRFMATILDRKLRSRELLDSVL